MPYDSKRGIGVSLVGNLTIGAGKLAASLLTGSAALTTEAVHSFVDAGNAVFILVGRRTSRRPADDEHPFGYGMDLYFWTLVVAMLIFALGSGFSLLHASARWASQEPVHDRGWAYGALVAGAVFDAGVWLHARRVFRAQDPSGRKNRNLLKALLHSKDPRKFLTLFEDTASLLGLGVAAVGVTIGTPHADAAAAVVVSLLMGGAAAVLAHEARKLLLGERADRDLVDALRRLAEQQEGVRSAVVRTVHFGPDSVLADVTLRLDPNAAPHEATAAMARLGKEVQRRHPQVRLAFDADTFGAEGRRS